MMPEAEPTTSERLAAAKVMFEDAEDMTRRARLLAERDRDYYDNWQLTDEQINELRKRGQPPVVINRIKRKVDWLLGLEAQRRTDPRAFPRTPQHEQDAEAATDAIRYVCDAQQFDTIGSAVFANMLVEGFGGCEVRHEVKRDGTVDVVLKHYPWDRLFYDPFSREPDFSDAAYLGAVVWDDAAKIKRQFPEMAGEIDVSLSGYKGETYEDRPRWVSGAKDRPRIRIVLLWHKDGDVWRYYLFTGGALLSEGVSPYVDSDGESVCPLILQSAYVDRENRRYGVVREMVDVQDEINKRRSKALHLLSQRQTYGMKGAVKSVAAMKRELAKPDGHVEIEAGQFGQTFGVIPTTDMAAANLQLLAEAKNEIDAMQASKALSGDAGSSASGRAVLAQQQGGLIELAPMFDRFQGWKKRVYTAIWNRIRQFWTDERWVRVTDDEKNVRFVGLNRPITLREQLQQMPEPEAMALAQQIGLQPGDPRLEMVVGVASNVATLDVDIILDEVPDAVTLAGETFEAIVNLATSGAVPVPPEMLIEVTPGLRKDRKDKLLEAIRAREEAAMQAQQAQGPIAEADAMSKIENKRADTLLKMAQAQRASAQTNPMLAPLA